MKLNVYISLHVCLQNGKELVDLEGHEYSYGNCLANNNDNVIIRDILICPLFRLIYNILGFLNLSMTDDITFHFLRNKKKNLKKEKNIKATGVIFPTLFCRKREIEFKLLECDENTVLHVFRVKDKSNFYYEVENGKIEVVYNGKSRGRIYRACQNSNKK